MALSNIELTLHRIGTKQFIDADPTNIILIPQASQAVAGTKKFVEGPPRAEQKFKIIWADDNGIVRKVGNDGGVRKFDFIIVGEHDAVVAINDFWKDGDQKFVIEYVFPSLGYEVKAGGISHGSSPT